jgi:hypothetical protein
MGQGNADIAHLELLTRQTVADQGAVWAGGAPTLAENKERVLQIGFHSDLKRKKIELANQNSFSSVCVAHVEL